MGPGQREEHVVLAEERELDGDEFRSELASHVSGRIGVNRDVLVFVHGFNTPFDEARDRAAQIVADSRFGGVAVLFTWPTKHELFGYVSDKDNATASRDALQALLQEISADAGRRQGACARPFDGRLAGDGGVAPGGDRRRSRPLRPSRRGDARLARHRHGRLRRGRWRAQTGERDRLRHRQRSRVVALQRHRPVAPAGRRDQPVEARGPRAARGARRQGVRPHRFSDGFIDHGAYADAPDVLHAIGSQMATPRPQDANTMSSIDASGYIDPSAAPPQLRRPRAAGPSLAADAQAPLPAPTPVRRRTARRRRA